MKKRAMLLIGVSIFVGSVNPSETESCDQFSELQCISSAACTLELISDSVGKYRCRTAENYCEEGFIQRTDRLAECELKSGCFFQGQRCYCPPDVLCRCGGGAPAMCLLRSESDASLPPNQRMQFAPAAPDRPAAGR